MPAIASGTNAGRKQPAVYYYDHAGLSLTDSILKGEKGNRPTTDRVRYRQLAV
jgi:hypothetical protein